MTTLPASDGESSRAHRPAARPRRSRLRLVVIAGAVVLVGVASLWAALAWRLARGPIQLDILTPVLVGALRPADGSLVVSAGSTQLAWAGWTHGIDLQVRDIEVTDPSGRPIASIPALAIRLSHTALLRGVIAPTGIEAVRPRVRLVREPDGRVTFGLGAAEPVGGAPLSHDVLDALLGNGDGAPISTLVRVTLSDADALVVDRAGGTQWEVRRLGVDLRRQAGAITARLVAAVAVGATSVPVDARARLRRAPDEAEVEVSFGPVEPAALPALGSVGAALALPLRGTAHLALDDALRPARGRVVLEGSRGTLALAALGGVDVGVEHLGLTARFDAGLERIDVEELTIETGGSLVRARGGATGSAGERAIAAAGTVSRLPVDALARYWPAGAAPEVRDWVTSNITAGEVEEATVTVRARLTDAASDGSSTPAGSVTDARTVPALAIDSVTGSIAFAGLSVRYLASMPAVTGVGGNATFAGPAWNFHVARGASAGLHVAGGTVTIAKSDRPRVAVDVMVAGALRDALALLDHEPLGYARALGIDPGDVSGTTTTQLRLDVPLDGPAPPLLGAVASAALHDVGVPRLVRGWSLRDGELALELLDGVLQVQGAAAVEGTPVTLVWRERLDAQSRERRVDVRGRIEAAGRATLGFDLRPWVEGPVDVDARLVQSRDARGTLQLAIDLRDAVLDVPLLALGKPSGAPGALRSTLTLTGATVAAVDAFDLEAAGWTGRGVGAFGADGALQTIDGDATIPPRAPGEGVGHVTLRVRPAPAGHLFTLTSDDAGTLLRALDSYNHAAGGRLVFAGSGQFATPGVPFEGHLDVRDFTLTRSPALARIATLASLSGIASALSDGGIPVERLDAEIGHRDDTVSVRSLVARGPSLRLIADGTVDRAVATAAFKGTLVPSYYGLNAMPKRLPLIGGIVGGADKEGVQVFDFTLTGPLADPRVSVDTASSLAPGALRDLMRRLSR